MAVLAAVGLVLVALRFYGAYLRLPYPFMLDYGEPWVLDTALRWDVWFQPADVLPHRVINYPPLYAIVVRGVHEVVGDVFLSGRTVSFASLLVSSALVYRLCLEQCEGRRGWAAVGGILFFVSPVAVWGYLARVDMLGLAFALGGLTAFVLDRDGRWSWAAVLCAAAVFTKHSFLAAPAAIALSLSIERDWKLLVKFSLLFGGICAVAGTAMVVATDGEAWRHLVTYHRLETSLRQLTILGERYLSLHWALGLLGVLGLSLCWRDLPVVMRCYALLALATVLAAARWGSNINYFLETTAVLSYLATSGVRAAWTRARGGRYARVVPLGLAALLLGQAASSAELPTRPRSPAEQLYEEMAPNPGDVVSEDGSLNLRLGRPILYQVGIMRRLISEGILEDDPLAAELAEQRYRYVVFFTPHALTARQREMLERYYVETDRVEDYRLYEPLRSVPRGRGR